MKTSPHAPAFVILLTAAALFLAWPTARCPAYEILIDLNTFKARDGIEQTKNLRCDGLWTIPQNSDLTDAQWQTVFANVGGGALIVEDNPAPHNVGPAPTRAYDAVKRVFGRVDGTLCYNETGSKPGATLLTNDQIAADAPTHGGKVIVLTRAYSRNPADTWRKETDRCLANPLVSGVAMETVVDYERYACDELVKSALKTYHKPVYFLLPTSAEKAEYVRRSVQFLQTKQPELLRDRQVAVVLCPYQTPGTPWFGPGPGSTESTLRLVAGINR